MKKIRVVAKVYDTTTHEYVRKYVTKTISDELAAMIQKELSETGGEGFSTGGHGCGENPKARLSGLSTPLASQKRFHLDPQFQLLDDNNNIISGWMGF